jgi:hypothetical protein
MRMPGDVAARAHALLAALGVGRNGAGVDARGSAVWALMSGRGAGGLGGLGGGGGGGGVDAARATHALTWAPQGGAPADAPAA